jgi:cytochrome P450
MPFIRFDRSDPEDYAIVMNLNEIMSSFGFLPYMPNWMYNISWNRLKQVRDFGQAEYDDHEKTYNPDIMRDLVDQYIRKRREDETEDRINSSFYGKLGQLNFTNVMSDLIIAGSETTSTFLTYLISYMINYPEVQERVREEICCIVGTGSNLLPSLADRERLPFPQAVISEVFRHANVAPFARKSYNYMMANNVYFQVHLIMHVLYFSSVP